MNNILDAKIKVKQKKKKKKLMNLTFQYLQITPM